MTQVSSLYIHVPFCKHLCNYCDFYKKKMGDAENDLNEFEKQLKSSIERHEKFLIENGATWSPLESLYLGGGTPSLWGARGAKFLSQNLFNVVPLKINTEFTMEIDPGTYSDELLQSWKDIGLNRISIGTQTLDASFLKIMDRDHSLSESHELLNICSKGNWNFSLDFLLGIPFSVEKKRNIKKELDTLLDYRPKHISLYILNARSKYPHINQIPDDEYIRDEFLFVSEYLRSNGFNHYEVSNFALAGYESRHNMKYWQSSSVAAIGPTGTGLIMKSKEEALRYKWKVSSSDFEIELLGESELALESMYLSLRTTEGFKPSAQERGLYHTVFMSWQERNLAIWDGAKVILNPSGFVILDSLMDEIFRVSAT